MRTRGERNTICIIFADIGKKTQAMNYISVSESAKKWNIPLRTARNYCATGKIIGVYSNGHKLKRIY